MDAAMLETDVYTDFQGFASLRARAAEGGEDVLREVAGQFEALFIQMMLKSMRDASLGKGLMDSDHTRTYQSMFDKQIALELSKRQDMGLAEMMVQQLSRSAGIEPGQAPAPVSPVNPLPAVAGRRIEPAVPPTAQGVAATPVSDWKPETPEEFVRELWPHARKAAETLGTRPEVLLAQAALETGWGQHMIRGSDGRNSFNLFGIKADAGWKGDRVVNETVEFRDGLMRRERARFRAYDSVADSFADYAAFLKTNPRYREVLKTGADGSAFVRVLAEAGYATDPDYSSKIDSIMGSRRLQNALPGTDGGG